MKKKISALLALFMALALCSCSAQKSGNTVKVYNESVPEEMSVTFLNTETDDTETVKLENKASADSEGGEYEFTPDLEKYDRVFFTSDGEDSIQLALNSYTPSYYVTSLGAGVGDDKSLSTMTDYKVKPFKYEKTEKNIYIWTPSDYNAKAKEKYSVIYMTDGQNLFNDSPSASSKKWRVEHCVEAMMKQSKNKAIVVGVDDSTTNRDSELTPDIGKVTEASYANGTGEYFSDFVFDKVVPYVEKNYNVYTDAKHNAICGSSSGGLECFYIGMEHPEKFGTIGALSPAFTLFSDKTWAEYLGKKDFKTKPFVYIYCGKANDLETALQPSAKSMVENLSKAGYDMDKVVYKEYDKGMHTEKYWGAVFPEFLEYMFK